jgi:hypothetical protein
MSQSKQELISQLQQLIDSWTAELESLDDGGKSKEFERLRELLNANYDNKS